MTAKEQGLPEGLEADIDAMRDVYLSPSQRGAYERILARAATYKSALASDTGERGVGARENRRLSFLLTNAEVIVADMEDALYMEAKNTFMREGMSEDAARIAAENKVIVTRSAAIGRAQKDRQAALRAQPAGGGEWLDCGHHESLMLKSAETGLPLYCALCDARTCASDNAIDAIEWKERALAAEADIERMTDAFNRENGPTFMGEPVLPPEKMVELEPGVRVPKWLLDDTRRVELYMKAHLPGPWRIGGIQSHDYANATPPESGGQGVTRVLRDFFFDAANQQHIPTLTVEFEPVKVGVPTNEAKGFQDRDRLAATLAQGGGNGR